MDEISDLLRARIDYFLKSPFEIRRNNICEVRRTCPLIPAVYLSIYLTI